MIERNQRPRAMQSVRRRALYAVLRTVVCLRGAQCPTTTVETYQSRAYRRSSNRAQENGLLRSCRSDRSEYTCRRLWSLSLPAIQERNCSTVLKRCTMNIICERCGIELPLRDGATGDRWETFRCTNCGLEHRAVFDEYARSAVRLNALVTGPTGFREAASDTLHPTDPDFSVPGARSDGVHR